MALRPTYPILTARLTLRPFAAADLDALHAIQSREDVTRFLYWGPRTREQVADGLAARAGQTALLAEGDALVLAVDRRDSGALIGSVNLIWVSAEHRQGEIGFVLHPDHQGQGFAGEAAAEMLRLGFDGLEWHRIVGRCDARNEASARLLERLGMRREAHFRENEWVKGKWDDEYVYALLAREWAAKVGG
ncbi:MAG: GNAT family N-acetyltransferase [Chloroflexota bacterium]|nr:GNAT family N-acetyltransferase [Chloroflexota bacterium]